MPGNIKDFRRLFGLFLALQPSYPESIICNRIDQSDNTDWEGQMKNPLASALLASVSLAAVGISLAPAAFAAAADVPVIADGISGVVSGPKGPEAGVWVIAETEDTPTRFIKIVVTDDSGRYLIP